MKPDKEILMDADKKDLNSTVHRKLDLSLVIPCYNEQEVIRSTAEELIREFQSKNVNLELILVDNGSRDATGRIIDGMVAEGFPVKKERVEINQGYGYGILCGLEHAQADLVGFTCADAQVSARDVVRAYEIAKNTNAPKLVKVRRRFRKDGLVRKIVSITYNLIATILFGGLGSIDINGNPKILPREYLSKMELSSKDWFLDPEVMIKAKRLKLGVLEFNVIAQMREGGASNVRAGTAWEFVINLIKYRFGMEGKIETK